MQRGNSIQWHVDQLTEHGTVRGAWIFPGDDGCDLVATLPSAHADLRVSAAPTALGLRRARNDGRRQAQIPALRYLTIAGWIDTL
jgi:hypothetical protein